MPPFKLTAIHDGVVVVAEVGVILRVVTSTGIQARQNLGSTDSFNAAVFNNTFGSRRIRSG
jgi:hypothetical protein